MKLHFTAKININSGKNFRLTASIGLAAIFAFFILMPPAYANPGKITRKHKALKARHAKLLSGGVPTLSYATPKVYTNAVAISPLTPSSSNVSAYGYGQNAKDETDFSSDQVALDYYGVALDRSGHIFVTDQGSGSVIEVLGPNQLDTVARGMTTPYNLAIDGSGNIYVADGAAGLVYEIVAGTNTLTPIGGGFDSPVGVAVDAAGNVYVTESTDTGDIKKIAAGTGVTTVVATGFDEPAGLAIDDAGNLFVDDFINGAVKEVVANGGPVITVVSNLIYPLNLAVDHAGTLFITLYTNVSLGYYGGTFYKFAGANQALTQINDPNYTYGAGTDGSGNLYLVTVFSEGFGQSLVAKFAPEGGYFINKALPAGLNFSSTTGVISGTPLAASPLTNYQVTAYNGSSTASPDSSVSASASVNITVNNAAAPALSYSTPLTFIVNSNTAAAPDNSGGPVSAIVYHNTATAVGTGFNLPSGVAKDAAGNVYVADRGNNAIKKIAGRGTTTLASGFNKPTGVAVDAAGNVYVADYGNNAVKKIAAGGTTAVAWGTGFSNPIAVAVDATGNVYVADKGNNAIKKISPTGSTTTTLVSGLNGPSAVAVDIFGEVYFANTGSGTVEEVPATGGTASIVYFGFSNPFGVAVDNASNLYIINEGDATLYKFNLTTTILSPVLGQEFDSPEGICIDVKGNIYIADTGNNLVKLVQPYNGYFISGKLPSGLSFNSSTGIISGTPTALTAAASYSVTGYNSGGSSTAAFTVQVVSSNADALLSNLSLSAGDLSPAFANNTLNYNVTEANSVTSVSLTATLHNSSATLTVNGVSQASGVASPAITLPVGLTTASIVVTAPDGTTTKTYTINITRLPSTNANLTSLVPGTGTLSPAFSAGTTGYTETVNGSTASMTIKPTVADNTATVTVNGTSVASGTASGAITLNLGTNVITTVVTAQDGTTMVTYTLTITKLSNDATLTSITTSPSIPLIPISGPGYKNYSASVPNTTNTVQIIAVTEDSTASIKVNGTTVASGTSSQVITLSAGDNVITTAVTAQDGTIDNYIITITRAPSSNANLGNLTVSQGTLSPVFSTSTTSYAVSVANSVTSITVTPTVADAATVKVNGTPVTSGTASSAIALSVGDNTISIALTAQDGSTTKTYTITVTRAPLSANANLSALSPSKGSLSPVFAVATLTYTDMVTNGTTSVTITPTVADPAATVKVNGTTVASGHASGAITLAVGSNTVTVLVTAPNGTSTQSYTVNVIRPSTNSKLSGLTISAGTLSPVFNTNTTSYAAAETGGTPTITITPTVAIAGATVKVNGVSVASGSASGPITLSYGSNTVTIVVTAQDGVTTSTYTIAVTKAASTNANLANIVLSKGTLSPTFAAAALSYTDMVTNGTASVTLTPTVADTTSKVTVNGTAVASGHASGAITLAVGSNAVSVVVTAQDGSTTKTYAVNVIRPSTNAKLSALTISSGTLTPAFNTNTTSYTASVSGGTLSMTLTPTVAVAGATVTVNGVAVASGSASGAIALSVGSNKITTIVTAQDGVTTDTYTLTVTRAAASTNDNLSNIVVSKGTLSPAFSSATLSYTDMVTNGTTSLTITPTVADGTATVTVNGTTVASGHASAAITLAVGSNNIPVVVTAQDGVTAQTYTVNVIRPSTNAKLANLTTSAGAVTPVFNPATTSYTLSVTNTTASVTITPTVAVTGAVVKVNGTTVASGAASGAIALTVGSNTITTVVTAQDGVTTDTYTITVTRAGSGENIPDEAVSVNKPAEIAQVAENGINIHQGLSPNGDGINDFLQIDNIGNYPENKLTIMNRNGQLVFEVKGYDNNTKLFDGHNNKTGQMQLPGTYFYSLDYTVGGVVKHKTGFLVLKY